LKEKKRKGKERKEKERKEKKRKKNKIEDIYNLLRYGYSKKFKITFMDI
jgi:hypothetical protein